MSAVIRENPVIAAGGINGTHHKALVKVPGVVTGRSGVLGNVFFSIFQRPC
jgi:type I restriction enzyme, S subunit